MDYVQNIPGKAQTACAVIVCLPDAGGGEQHRPFGESKHSFLLHVVDRTVVQHCLERIVTLGVKHIHLLVEKETAKIESVLGDGSRWGCTIEYHLVSDSLKPFQTLHGIGIAPTQPLLVACGDHVLNPSGFAGMSLPSILLGDSSINRAAWLYATLPQLLEVSEKLNTHLWSDCLQNLGWSKMRVVGAVLDCSTGLNLLQAQSAVLSGEFPAQHTGVEVQPGIWVSRNVILHPSVKLHAPVYIGEDCYIEKDVVLGPNISIGRSCRIGSNTVVENSAIEPGTWAGEMLMLKNLLIKPKKIWNTKLDCELVIADSSLLSTLAPKELLLNSMIGKVGDIFSRCIAFLILLISVPLRSVYVLLYQPKDVSFKKVESNVNLQMGVQKIKQ